MGTARQTKRRRERESLRGRAEQADKLGTALAVTRTQLTNVQDELEKQQLYTQFLFEEASKAKAIAAALFMEVTAGDEDIDIYLSSEQLAMVGERFEDIVLVPRDDATAALVRLIPRSDEEE